MIYLVEHFFSIQGEGRYSGVPSIFLRFGGCNLRCRGFGAYEIGGERIAGCDTIRAVHTKRFKHMWKSVDDEGALQSVVMQYVDRVAYRPDIILTGGEPMIYAEDPIFYETVVWMLEHGFRVTIETNATLAPPFEAYPAYRDVTFAMAVKLSNSGEPKAKRVVPGIIRRLAEEGNDSFFKFTLDSTSIEKEVEREIREICEPFENEIYCMPLGDNVRQLQANAPVVAEFCLRSGYRYSDRLHVRLWNREEKR
ncbi:7-carboxy-7-deazaguanine synthase QueE [Hydrogenimonas cancrithermarum]|uniref:7-carboxy-7-deazaguanine synthase n=1 Tax=Hydrogenimonas cancrithermarum TaxID=2993563 RepID=A0ABM8FKG0_9BACT|nr:7-carboxy-7-deazaguanine synthase QueE [Hydrogenimonas cancrithermarum]BDY12781.1 7-carboxy-7-deazaguanine synthase [Hydrogenimonas cancrithermarum]